ncbi:hypothetical protein [Candidatus Arsenophonus triatominarum]|uniref:hypothetical protein n=1 Tax=Candidatus Arsenophonus triatominarum TaxID=57911 RepID=UPI000A4AD819|nr:hypothetical protein [Candidatus Arsenophonus triatominarum]
MGTPNLSVKATRLAYVMGIDALSVVPSCDGKLLRLYLHDHLLIQIELSPKIKHERFNH